MLDKVKKWIEKAIKHLEIEFSKLQVWRANPSILDDIKIDQYGSMQAIQNLATIWNLDSQTLSIKPWDKTVIHPIAKAISEAGLWLNPQTMADSIIIKIPPLTEERRKDIVKIAKKILEEAKIAIRNARWESLKDIKKALESKEISEDDEKRLEKELQELVNDANKKAEELYKKKETDIMKI